MPDEADDLRKLNEIELSEEDERLLDKAWAKVTAEMATEAKDKSGPSPEPELPPK
jgi:hypothetical protein